MLLNEERDEITDRTVLEPGMSRTDCGIDISGRDPGKFLDQPARDLSQRLLLSDLAHRLPASIPARGFVNQSRHEHSGSLDSSQPEHSCRANTRQRCHDEPMTDPNVAQAAVLIAALTAHLRDMTPKLLLAERQADSRHAAGARAMRQIAAELRRDINEAQFLIARLRRRFPDTGQPPAANEIPDQDTPAASARVDNARARARTRWTDSDQRRVAAV